jgi:hypothetical protein
MFDAMRAGNAGAASCDAGETLASAFCPRGDSSDGAKRANGHRWYLFWESIMNVSWSDLNNVQEAGDYPFRDGTITVTFAEVAIWKNNRTRNFS